MSGAGWMFLAVIACGPVCVLLAAAISLTLFGRMARLLIGFSAGLLVTTALVHLMPDALNDISARRAGLALVCGLGALLLIERLALFGHGHDAADGRSFAGPAILLGDGLHKFTDGLLMAAAFLESPTLGWTMTLAVFIHELPREAGDFVVLLACGYDRRRALQVNLLASLSCVAGGAVGWIALSQATSAIPYALCISAASFLYVALTRLVPLLQQAPRGPKPNLQYLLVVAGAGFSLLSTAFGHG